MHKYRAFGLNIASEFEIPELIPSEFNMPDVQIDYGQNPPEITDYKGKGVLYQARENEFLFRLKTVASYYVKNGKQITVERLNDSTDDEIRLFLLGSAMGALIQQRDLLPVHGSAVVKNGQAYIIAGVSGSGKSSLAAVLIKRGFKLLSEDISVVDPEKIPPEVNPGIPYLKLWQDVLEELGEDVRSYAKVRPQLLKYRKHAGSDYINEPVMLKRIIVLSARNKPEFESKQVKGAEKFELLKKNTYRYQYLLALGKIDKHFKLVNQLAKDIQLYHVQRPSVPLMLEQLADFLMEKKLID